MREQGAGSIVNIASTTAINGSAGFAHYVASKGAVIALTRSMAREAGPLGIRVNVIAPGFTLTEASRELFAEEGRDPETYALDRGSLKRPAQPEDVVGAALCGSRLTGAGYVTGQTIVVDGGRIFVWGGDGGRAAGGLEGRAAGGGPPGSHAPARGHAVGRSQARLKCAGLTNPQRIAMSRTESPAAPRIPPGRAGSAPAGGRGSSRRRSARRRRRAGRAAGAR